MNAQDLLIFINFPILWFILIIGLVYIKKTSKDIKRYFEPQVMKRNGEITWVNFLIYPSLIIPCGDLKLIVSTFPGGKNAPPSTSVSCKFSLNQDYHLNIYPEVLLAKLGKTLGMKDLQSGNPEFDEAFIIQGGDETMVRNFLNVGIQYKLLLLKGSNPKVTILKNSFELSISEFCPSEPTLDNLIETAGLFINQMSEVGIR